MSRSRTKIWEARRHRLTFKEPKPRHVKIDGEVYQLRGWIRRKAGNTHASLEHVLTRKHYITDWSALFYKIKKTWVKELNELEALAWAATI